jgi:hypothetical protein
MAALLCKSASYVQKALTLSRQFSTAAKQFIADHTERFSSLDMLYDIAQTSDQDQITVLRQVVQVDLSRDQVREVTAPLKKTARAERGKNRGRKPGNAPAVHAFTVPCGAKVTVTFPKPTASRDDIEEALQQAMDMAKAQAA